MEVARENDNIHWTSHKMMITNPEIQHLQRVKVVLNTSSLDDICYLDTFLDNIRLVINCMAKRYDPSQ